LVKRDIPSAITPVSEIKDEKLLNNYPDDSTGIFYKSRTGASGIK